MPRQTQLRLFTCWLAAAMLSAWAGPSLALDDPGQFDRAQIQAVPAHLLPGSPAASNAKAGTPTPRALATPDPFRFASVSERLQALPLRPIVIGERPRIPSDPDPGVGLVFRIPLSL